MLNQNEIFKVCRKCAQHSTSRHELVSRLSRLSGLSAQRPCKTAAGLAGLPPDPLCQNAMPCKARGSLPSPTFLSPLPFSLISVEPLNPAARRTRTKASWPSCAVHTHTHSSTATLRAVKGNKQMSLKGSAASAVAGIASTAFPPLPSSFPSRFFLFIEHFCCCCRHESSQSHLSPLHKRPDAVHAS